MTWTTHPISEFPSHEAEWARLNKSCADTPLLDLRFLKPLLEEFATGDEVLALYRDPAGGAIRAVGIFVRVNRFAWQTMQPANAPLGLWVCAPDLQMQALLPSLARALSPLCLILGITQQDPAISARPDSTDQLGTKDYITTARVVVESSFAEYLQSRSKNFKHNVKRQKNRLEREGIAARLEVVVADAALDEAVADFSRLENSGWKASIDSSFEFESAQGRFYRKMLKAFAEDDEAFCYKYLFDNVVAACDLGITHSDCLYILKTTYDEARKGYSPAHLMRTDLFAQALDKPGIRRVEFYGPVMDWHTKLTSDVRTMYHVNFYRWPFVRRLHERAQQRKSPPANGHAPAGSGSGSDE
jgi:CelD/BcsL family acetyltransferase involved in cellulose biosynthesis